ncbi:MAG: hypothetical protein Kow0059_17970 [Candidatus Sumerlaeia bacterium]
MDPTTASTAVASAAEHPAMFNYLSWLVILAYVAFTTWLGHYLSGRQATIRDFFLGGRKLPWYAVSGSIIATELSAMTLVGVPAFLWADTGDMKYMILGLGTIIARIIVAIYFIPKYYEEEIYSPYEYIGNQIGKIGERTTSMMFMLGGMLGQGARVYLTAVVLDVITGVGIIKGIWIVGVVSVLWTWLGGITTVIWTDLIQFLLFTFTALLTLFIVYLQFMEETKDVPQGALEHIINLGINTARDPIERPLGKLTFWDWRLDSFRSSYNIWTACIASVIGSLAAYGTDQMMAQRIFCCKSQRDAKIAIIVSSCSQILMVICLFVGLFLWAYYKHTGDPTIPYPEELKQINDNSNRLLAVFIKYRVHWLLGGLMVSGIFAAAISSLDSILAALSQQTLAWIRGAKGEHRGGKEEIALSRVFIIFWAVVLCGMATIFHVGTQGKGLLIELALSVVGYVWGAILGAFLLAYIPQLRVKGWGVQWGAALSVMTIVAITRHQTLDIANNKVLPDFSDPNGPMAALLSYFAATWVFWILVAACLAVLVTAVISIPRHNPTKSTVTVVLSLLPFIALIFFFNLYQYPDASGAASYISIGWPWYAPLGATVMICSSLLLCERAKPGENLREA